jgi:hypothetical protein
MREPQYKHDMDCCQFIGQYKDACGKYDLYCCDGGDRGGSMGVTARFGDEGEDYISLPNLNIKTEGPLLEAQRLAKFYVRSSSDEN